MLIGSKKVLNSGYMVIVCKLFIQTVCVFTLELLHFPQTGTNSSGSIMQF